MNRQWTCFLVLLAAAVWAWWDTLLEMANRWSRDPQYSHGYLIPAFAAGLLWLRRDRFVPIAGGGSWWGLPLLAAALVLRWLGARFYIEWLDAVSLLPCLAGIFVIAFGRPAVAWALPAVAFLIFMIPLPYRVEMAIQFPLRRLGTIAGVYAMQTGGLPAVANGNTITIGDVDIGVAEACSGLSMLMVFMALTTAVAMLSQRPMWQRVVLFLSGVPIALASNVVRISITGILFASEQSEWANHVFHDLFGLLIMMPLAFALLCGELWLLTRLVLVEQKKPLKIGLH